MGKTGISPAGTDTHLNQTNNLTGTRLPAWHKAHDLYVLSILSHEKCSTLKWGTLLLTKTGISCFADSLNRTPQDFKLHKLVC